MTVRIVRLGTPHVADEGTRLGTVPRAPAPSQALDALAALSKHANFSLGCYCEDETHCHRS
jgi:uncharacterized protein YeaO (DUF488 family)